MKKTLLNKCLGDWRVSWIVAGLLAVGSSTVRGASTTNVFSFDTSGSTGAWALPAWGGQGAGSAWDGTQDSTGNSGGSLHVIQDWSLGDQMVDLGWFSGGAWWNPGSAQIDLTQYTNCFFYIKWDAANSSADMSVYNSTGETLQLWAVPIDNGATGWIDIGPCPVPAAASNGWVKVNVPISASIPGISTSYGLGLKKWVGNGLTSKFAFWIDDITIEATPVVLPPPTVHIAKPGTGMNIFAATGLYNRESLKTVNGQSWVGRSGPVSYSYTIKQGVDGTGGAQFQNHVFLASNPGTETSPDWNEANVIFLDMESQTNGGVAWTFRYKTNQPSGNSMCYDTNVVPGILNDTNRTGTWTVTFLNDTNVTMTGPSGGTTNFDLPTWLPPLFPDTVSAYFGVQANNSTGIGGQSIYSEIKIQNTANPLDDVFTTDSSLNTNNWSIVSVDPSVIQVPPSAAFWITWTVPDAGFSLVESSNIAATVNWVSPVGVSPVQMGGIKWALMPSSSLPAGRNGFFGLIKRAFTQMQVLLPGETNAPGTVSGKIGTPTPSSYTVGTIFPVTINAVDSTFHIVNTTGPTIALSSGDTSATFDTPASLVNGTVVLNAAFGAAGTWTITATNQSSATMPTATSASLTAN
jgi:hypothetical protein